MYQTEFIGVDVGNSDTKTALTSTPSGFGTYDKKPFGSISECLVYNGKFYVPPTRRFLYRKDKTTDDRGFILTLFAIAKELIARANVQDKEELRQEIANVHTINLGVGLPPTHCQMFARPTADYYKRFFGDRLEFSYNGIPFSLKLGYIGVYPQDYAAIFVSPESQITKDFDTYYGIDIGGYTADGIGVENNAINYELCDSKPLGIIKMYDAIIAEVENRTSTRLSPDNIFHVLQGKQTVLRRGEDTIIKESAKDWARLIIEEFSQYGYEFAANPTIFLGGGSKLLRPYIEEVMKERTIEFFTKVSSNAVGFECLVKESMKR